MIVPGASTQLQRGVYSLRAPGKSGFGTHTSDDEPLLRLTHRGRLIHHRELIGHYLRPEHLQVLETYLRDWLSRPDDQAKKHCRFDDLDE